MRAPTHRSVSLDRFGFPNGALALLFTDIEGSTAILQRLGAAYVGVLETHRRILRSALAEFEGVEVDSQGDAIFAVFSDVSQAARAAIAAQRALRGFDWPQGGCVRVRMGLHFGAPARTPEGYAGLDLHIGARLMSAGHGQQILCSGEFAQQLKARAAEFSGCEIRDFGEHRLKDLERPVRIFELAVDDIRDFAPLRTLSNRPHHVPSASDSILGREREIQTARVALSGGARLLTLLGPGGTGKTRLALQIAAEMRGTWADGAFWVSLAPISARGCAPRLDDAEEKNDAQTVIASAIARELGLRDRSADAEGAAQKSVAAHLAPRETLLVLDNFEHLLDGASLVSRLLAACPRLQILVTSRVALNLSGEREFPVAPLALPTNHAISSSAPLENFAAIALFLERARAVSPDFVLNANNGATIAQICRRVDGLPLAIELAAARVKFLPPAQLLQKLEENLWFLSGGARDWPARQQTLRATIEWSHELLSADEKRLFRRLGVFRGGFSFEVAQKVCCSLGETSGETSPDETPCDAFSGLVSLFDQSLLVRSDTGENSGETRFSLLETIREFALESLEKAGETRWIRERHLAWIRDFSRECDTQMHGDFRAALARFETEADNWREAWNDALRFAPEIALELAATTALLWNRLGATRENYERLETALAAAPNAGALAQCRALHFLTQTARNRCDWASYAVWIEQLETQAQKADSPEFMAIALDQRRWDDVKSGCLDAALARGERVVELRRRALEEAREQPNESAKPGEILRHEIELGDAQIYQADVLAHVGHFEAALAQMEAVLERKRAIGEEFSLTFGLYKYAQILADSGQIGKARALFEEIVERTQNTGDRSVVLAWYCHEAALLALRENDAARARELLRQSYFLWRENAPEAAISPILKALAQLQLLENQPRSAARTLAALRAHCAAQCEQLEETELQLENQLRQQLGEAEFRACREFGGAPDAQKTIENALR